MLYIVMFHEPSARSAAASEIPHRADIVDRNGRPIALNLPTYDLYIVPKKMADAERSMKLLERVIAVPDRTRTGRRFLAHRNLSPDMHTAIINIGEPGFEMIKARDRYYPAKVFSHILGFVDVDNRGISGIEKYIDEAGMAAEERVFLSVDTLMQEVLHRHLTRAISSMNAKQAAGIVMDSKTGEILAMVSLPDWPGGRMAKMDQRFNNHAALSVFEMGSVMKIFNHAMAIENRYPKSAKFNVAAPFMVGNFRVRDSHPPKPVINMDEAFAFSSNIASATMARDIGSEKQRAFLEKLGLFSRIDFELPERGTPIFPRRWNEHINSTAAYGYGISITMLHFIAAANAIVNDGMFVRPTLIRQSSPPPLHQVVRQDTSLEMRRLMRMVMEEGTAVRLGLGSDDVGGKTGTALKLAPGGGYHTDKMRTFFFGAYPIDSPRITFIIMLDEANNKGCLLAGCTAAEVGGWIIREIL